ncbi:MAG: hypothetical protein V9E99_13545 [Microthrixaceae bacterium]
MGLAGDLRPYQLQRLRRRRRPDLLDRVSLLEPRDIPLDMPLDDHDDHDDHRDSA